MRTLGVYVRIAEGRYRVGFALVEAATVLDAFSLAAPAGETEERQLSELFSRTSDVVSDWGPGAAALWVAEVRRMAVAARAHRAEGVVMAAANAAGCPVTLMSRQRLANHAPGSRAVAALVATVLCERLDWQAASEEEGRAAAAAFGHCLDEDRK